MTRKNIIGGIIALLFPLLIVGELASGPIRETFLKGVSILALWLACAYWRYGEGIDDSYKRECAEHAAIVFGLSGFNCLLPILEKLIDDQVSIVLLAFVFADLALIFRLYPRVRGIVNPPRSWRFFLFQTPEPILKHTGISDQ